MKKACALLPLSLLLAFQWGLGVKSKLPSWVFRIARSNDFYIFGSLVQDNQRQWVITHGYILKGYAEYVNTTEHRQLKGYYIKVGENVHWNAKIALKHCVANVDSIGAIVVDNADLDDMVRRIQSPIQPARLSDSPSIPNNGGLSVAWLGGSFRDNIDNVEEINATVVDNSYCPVDAQRDPASMFCVQVSNEEHFLGGSPYYTQTPDGHILWGVHSYHERGPYHSFYRVTSQTISDLFETKTKKKKETKTKKNDEGENGGRRMKKPSCSFFRCGTS